MKIDGSEIAPSGKRRLKIYLGELELEVMRGLVQQALKYTPSTDDTRNVLNALRAMNRDFEAHYFSEEVSQNSAIELPSDRVELWFDGGTPCNVPRLGYGEGYGSFKVGLHDIVSQKYGQAMSANCAEIRTVTEGIYYFALKYGKTSHHLHIVGDSQIALKWVSKAFGKSPMKVSGKSSPLFIEAIEKLYVALDGFSQVTVEWKSRIHMVQLFGH